MPARPKSAAGPSINLVPSQPPPNGRPTSAATSLKSAGGSSIRSAGSSAPASARAASRQSSRPNTSREPIGAGSNAVRAKRAGRLRGNASARPGSLGSTAVADGISILGVEIHGSHGLDGHQLVAVMQLRQAARSRCVHLQQMAAAPPGRTLAMYCEGGAARTRLPSIIKVHLRSRIEMERDATLQQRKIFGDFCPRVIETVFDRDWGAIQLELTGGKCCLPNFVSLYSGVEPFSKLFLEAASGDEDAGRKSAVMFKLMHQVLRAAVPGFSVDQMQQRTLNVVEDLPNVRMHMLAGLVPAESRAASPFGSGYFDGTGADSYGIDEERGSLVSDGTSDLQKIVQDVTGKSRKPSQFFADFAAATERNLTFWSALRSPHSPVHGDLSLENALHDGYARTWLIGFAPGAGRGHIFTDPAKWLAAGLFALTPISNLQELRQLRDLVMMVASVPDSLELHMPNAPNVDLAPHVSWAWSFTQRTFRHLSAFGQAAAAAGHLERPGLQLVWVLLDAALDLVTSRQNRSFPDRKRLALFGAVAFATRLDVASGKTPEPKWLVDKRRQWKGVDNLQTQEEVDIASLHLQRVGAEEAWTLEHTTGEKHSVLDEAVSWDLEGAEVSPQGFAELFELLQQRRRLLITGAPGSGRTFTTRGLVTHLVQQQVEEGVVSRLPVRVPASRLALEDEAVEGDPLQAYIAETCSRDVAVALQWETLDPPPWPQRSGHQLISLQGRLFLLGGLAEGQRLLADAWVSSDLGRTWEQLPQPPWAPRHGHQALAFEDGIYVIAGIGDADRKLRDVWQSRDGGCTWHELPCPRWKSRSGHQAVVMKLRVSGNIFREHIVVMGGETQGQLLQDAWASENSGYSWKELDHPPWPARAGHQAVIAQNKLFVIGGLGENKRRLRDVWVIPCGSWSFRTADVGTGASKRQSSGDIAHLPGWQEYPDCAWPGRDGHRAIVYRGKVVIFGGTGDSDQPLSDAWASADGSNWRKLPNPQWSIVAERVAPQVIAIDGRHVVVSGLPLGKRKFPSVLLSRSLVLVVEHLDDHPGAEKHNVTTFLDNVLTAEPHHWLIMAAGHTASYAEMWGMPQLRTKPLSAEDLRSFCERRLSGLEPALAQSVQAQLTHPSFQDLVGIPLFVGILLRAIHERGAAGLSRCEGYSLILEHCLQSLEAAKQHDTSSEFQRNKEMGLDLAVGEVALLFHSHGRRHMLFTELSSPHQQWTSSEAIEKLSRLTLEGRLMLLEAHDDGLRFRYPSMQEFLAASQLWRKIGSYAAGLPTWLLKEGGAGTDFAVGCGRFFCSLAAGGKRSLNSSHFRDAGGQGGGGVASVLRNVARAGDDHAAQSLLTVTPTRERQALLLSVDTLGQGQTALHLAAINGHFASAAALLDFSPDPEALHQVVDLNGYVPLHYAAQRGHEATARVLVQHTPCPGELLVTVDTSQQRYTALHLAAMHGRSAVAQTLLELAPSAAALSMGVDTSGFTALHFASKHGHEATVVALLDATPYSEVLLHAKNKFEMRTPLHLAAAEGRDAVACVLLDRSPDRKAMLGTLDKLGQTALHLAAEGGHGDTVRVLLQGASDPGALLAVREKLSGQTALHLASAAGHGAAIRPLLEAAPDQLAIAVTADKCGRHTALHLAAERGHVDAVTELLQLTPDRQGLLRMVDGFAGQTALHLAANAGHEAVVAALLELSPDAASLQLAADNSGGFTPLHLAAEQGHANVVQVLLERAKDVGLLLGMKVAKWCGFTALHLSAFKGHESVANMLVHLAHDRERVISALDHKERTAVQIALDRGRAEVATLLTNYPLLR